MPEADLADDVFCTFFLRVVFFFCAVAAGFRAVEVFLAGRVVFRLAFFFAFVFSFFFAFTWLEEAGFDRRVDFFRAFIFFFAVPEGALRFFAPDLAAIKKQKGCETN